MKIKQMMEKNQTCLDVLERGREVVAVQVDLQAPHLKFPPHVKHN